MPPPSHARHGTPTLTLTALLLALCAAATLHAQEPAPGDPNVPQRVMPRRPDRFSQLPPTQPTTLPPTPPTSNPLPAGNALPAPIAATPTAEQPASLPHRAHVTFLNGQLNVRANDSSLNQILRSISRETGLKITGGVRDQRVFGDYGPASTASILATLLDGTGTNLLLLEGDPSTPPELILTPRGGGPTPPSPTDPGFVDNSIDDTPPPQQQQPLQTQQQQPQPQTSGPRSMPQPLNNVNGSPLNTSPTASTFPTTNSVSTDTLPTPSTTPSTSGIVDAPNPPAPGSTTGTAPHGTPTPEQIYQELLQQQKAQQQQQTNPQPPPNTPQLP